ncbi:predicted protein [Postia placenta Mad-698-R]|nr:predicted protein [Postia placenta Mad-698-R]
MSSPASPPNKETLRLLLPLRYDGKTVIECDQFLSQLRIYWLVNMSLTTTELKVQVALSLLDDDTCTWVTPFFAQLVAVQLKAQGVMTPFANEAAFATALKAHFGNLDDEAAAQVELAKLYLELRDKYLSGIPSRVYRKIELETFTMWEDTDKRAMEVEQILNISRALSSQLEEEDEEERAVVHPDHTELRPASTQPSEKETSPAVALAARSKGGLEAGYYLSERGVSSKVSRGSSEHEKHPRKRLRTLGKVRGGSTRRRSYSEAVGGRYDYREWHTSTRGFALSRTKLPHRVARIKSIGCGKEAPGHLERECGTRPMKRHVSAPPEEPARRMGVVVDNVFLEGIINEAKERKEKERQTKAVPIPPPRSTNPEPPTSPVAGPSRPRPDTPVVFRKVDPDWTPNTTQWTWDSSWPNQKHLSGEEWTNVGRNARKEWFDEEEGDGVDWELYGDGEHLHNGVRAHFVPGIVPLRFFLYKHDHIDTMWSFSTSSLDLQDDTLSISPRSSSTSQASI